MPEQRFTYSGLAGLAGLLTLLVLLLTPPALAQEPSGAGGEPAYGTMADLLEDESSRNALIEELRALQAARANDAAPTQQAPAEPAPMEGASAREIAAESPSGQRPEDVSFARRMADATGHMLANIGDQFLALGAALGGVFMGAEATADSDLASVDNQRLGAAAINLAILAIATFVLFVVLRVLARPSFRALGGWARRGSEKFAMLRTMAAVAVAGFVDVVVVAFAYLAGALVSSLLVNNVDADATRLALFLNAFLVVELFKAALRMLFSPRYEGLRLVSVSAEQAGYCHRVLANLASFIGYGMLVLVPVLNFNLSPSLGAGVGSLIMLLALAYAVWVILKKRTTLRDQLLARAERSSGPGRVLLRLFGRLWHVLALAYAFVVFVVTVIDPKAALPYVAWATLLTVLYAGAGLLASAVLTQLIGRQIQLSDRLNQSMPHLQARVNTYVPTALKVVRALILAMVVVFVLDAWQVYDLAAWYATEAGAGVVGAIVDILLILLVAAAVWVTLASLLEHKLSSGIGADPTTVARAETLLGLFHTALAITILIITTMIVLSEVGIDIAPLIAGAGVLGLAIGFGAQKLVQDVITGVFIQLENAINTGDYVEAGGNEGTVERVGIRSVSMRDLSGTYHIVPFSAVGAVSNYTRDFGNHVGEYAIAYRENIDAAIAELEAAFKELAEGPVKAHILEPMSVAGVIALADSSVNIRVIIKTTPGMQWAVGRAYNRLVKMYFDRAGIEIPFPHSTLYFGHDRTGAAPPANLRLMQDDFVVDGSPPGQPKREDLEG